MAILWDNISLSVRKLDKTQLSRLQSTAENSSDEAVLITLSPKNTLIKSFDAFASVFQRSQSNLLEFQPLSKQISFDPNGVSHSFLVQINPDEKAAFQLRLAGVSELSLDDTILNIVFLDNEKYIVYEDSQTETANLSKQFLKIPHLLTEVIPDLESNALEEVNLLDIEAFQDIPVSNIINFQNEIDATETVSLSLSDTANSSVAENVAYSAAAPTLTGTPIGDVTYSLSGDDASLFSVATDGAVSMVGRDFENPADTGSNNTYSYTLIATDDDGNTASDGVTVTITDATETVSLSLSDTANSSVAENVAYSAAAPTLTGTPIGDVTYSLSGDDASLFSVATDGAVSMVGRDFENPADTGSNNTYSYTLIATDDDGNTASDGVTVTITDATETVSLSLSDTANSSVAENVAYSAAAPTLTGTPIGDVTYSLSGDDASLFSVATDGAVSMVGRDFENPADTGSNNTYSYTLIATDDDGNTASDGVTVTITDATLTMSDTANSSVAENVAYSASAPTITGAPMGTVTYSLAGSDASLFSVAADGAVSMAGQDFENPADTGDDNVYHYTLIAQDEEVNAAYDQVYVTVTDAIEGDTTAPTISSFSSTTSNGSYNVGDTINITATASESIQSGNTLTVTLDTGDTVLLTAASAGTTLTGTYTVGTGDTSNDLTVSSFAIGTVADTAGNAMTSTTVPSSNNIADSSAIVIDTSAPTISSFSSSTSDGSYNVGDEINITATTSESIQSGNTITVTLDTGDTVVLTAASAGTTLTGTYTVGAGDTSSDLTVSSFAIGTVADTAGNAMTSTTVPSSNNIADNSAIVVDTSAPTLSSSSPADDATAVAVGSNIVLNFSEAVDVESGDIVIYKTSDNSVIETIAVGSGQVTGTGTTQITINPSSDLASSTQYYVKIAATGFDDAAGNSYAGITDTTSLSFTTAAPSLSINDVSYTETSSASNATFTVTLSEASGQDVTVDYASSDVSTTAGSDYTASSGTVTISAGATSATFTVPILVDTLDESNETATVTLSNASNASISDATGTLTIVDDDPVPTLSIDNVSHTESSSAGNATFTVTLSEVSGKDVTVDYASSDVSTTAGSDYTAISGTVTILAGNTTASINVPILVDTLDESNETATVTLSNPTNATIASEATQIGSDIDGEAANDYSGNSVSLSSDGSIVAIGAWLNDVPDSGHVRIYQNNSGTWSQIGDDIDGEANNDHFGVSVSLSGDGSIVAIGADQNGGNGENSGHVRIYQNNSGTWSQVGSDIDGEAANDRSGQSVSLSSDGSTVAIGAYVNDGNGNTNDNRGHVRIYQNNSGTWSQVGSDIDGEASNDSSGQSVSLSSDGSIVAIGAYQNDGNGSQSGHVRIYQNNSGTWSQVGSDIDGEGNYDSSGQSVSLSSDGSIVAIGAYGNDGNGTDSGHVRVYQNNSGNWEQIGSDIDGEAASNYFGYSVSLSSDGSIVAIGAHGNDDNGTNSGHVRIYKYESDSWSQVGSDIDGEAASDESGRSVSLSSDGSTVAIGAWLNDGNGTDSGHVRVFDTGLSADTGTLTIVDDDVTPSLSIDDVSFTESGSAGNATFTVTLSEVSGKDVTVDYASSDVSTTAGSDYTAISGTVTIPAGNTTASINVPILVDTLDESNETARVTLSDPTNATIASVPVDKLPTVEATQIGSDIDGEDASDESGRSVSLSSDGSIVAIGAYYNGGNGTNSGHVRIYENDSGTWEQIGSDIDGEAADNVSGYSVSLSSNGSIVAIGARGNDENGTDRGHVRIYQYNSGTNNWSQIGSDIDGEAADDKSGHSVSLSSDGSTVAIGAKSNDGDSVNNSGHVRIYKYNSGTNNWSQIGSDIDGEAAGNESGTSVSLSSDGSIVAIGATGNDENGTDSGHVRIYENNSGTWSQIGLDIDGEAAGDYFGTSVSLSSDGSIVAIGAKSNDGNGYNSGHVRIYQNNSGTWSQIGSDIDGEDASDYFGTSVSLSSDGSIVAIGAHNNDGNGSNSGHVRIYQNIEGTWSQIRSDIDGESLGDKSGTSVSLSSDGSIVAIGAHYNDGNGSNSGHVRVFDTGLSADTGTLTIIDDDGDTTASAATLTISTSGFIGATTTSVPSGASGLNAIVEDNLNSAINGTSSADYIEIQDTPNSNAGSISGGNGDDIIYIKGWGGATNVSVTGDGGSDTLYINPSIFGSKSNWVNNNGIKSGTIHFTNGGSININNFEAVNGIWGGAGGQFERNISVTATLNDTDGSESLSDITVSNLPDNTTVKDSDGNAVTVSSNAFTVDNVVSGTAQVFTLTKAGPFDFTASGAITVTESNGGATTTTNSSVLIDGVVEGVEYLTTSGMSGLTNQEGQFNYQDGDDITFKVGGVVLGTATAEDVTSGRTFLQDIADVERSNLSDDYLENMAVFLQSLDENHDSSDGIVITDDTRLALQNVDFDLREASEEELQHLIEQIGGQYVNEADAMKHVKDMLIQHADMTETDFDKSGLSMGDAVTSNESLTVNTVDLSAIQAVEPAPNPASINTIDAESIDFKNVLDTGGGALELNAIVNQAVHATQISEKDFNTPEISELPALKVEEIGPTFDNKHAQDDARDFQEQFTVYV